jgi:uncharacterized protein (TIGR03118 family)
MRRRVILGALAAAGTAAGVGAAVTPAGAATLPRVRVLNLITDRPFVGPVGPLVDRNLVNPWGLALSPAGPLWVANNGTNTATVYSGGSPGTPVKKVPLTVKIPGGAPTGQVFNDTASGFVIPAAGTRPAAKATFIFASESGDITAWNPAVDPTNAVVVAHVDGAVYKGLAIMHFGTTGLLLAADFRNARIDVFNASFVHVPQYSHFFVDRNLPPGYAPFNVVVGPGSMVAHVAFAKQDPKTYDEVAGPGLGVVDMFVGLGGARRIATGGTLNAPWGMAVAPAGFGDLLGTLLVGNFGDGHISAFRFTQPLGLLRDRRSKPVTIEGLWGLQVGTATTGGTDAVWFSAGPGDEQHGLVGQLRLDR